MKLIVSIFTVLLALHGIAQEKVMVFQSSNLEMNIQSEKVLAKDEGVSTITVDLNTNMLTIETENKDLVGLMREKLELKITKVLGDVTRTQFSLQLDGVMFAHFFLDKEKVIMTRSDIHPLKWGVQLREVVLRDN